MTRRSITAVLGSIVVSLLILSDAPAVFADDMSGGGAPHSVINPGDACVAADAAGVSLCLAPARRQAPGQATDLGPIFRVPDSSYYVPAAGGMWAVIRYPADGLPVIEDYVSGPPAASGIAVTAGDAVTGAQPICTAAPDRRPTCYTPQADGSWAVEILQADGRWVRSATQLHPPPSDELQRGSSG